MTETQLALAALGLAGAGIYMMMTNAALALERIKNRKLLVQLDAERLRCGEAESFAQRHRDLLQEASDMLAEHVLEDKPIPSHRALNIALAAEKLLNGGQYDLQEDQDRAAAVSGLTLVVSQ